MFLPEGPQLLPQLGMANPLEDIERERRRQMLERILQAPIAQQQSQWANLPDPIRQVVEARFAPERQARMEQMRAETPDVLARQYYDQYWGTPTSKAGKFGQGVLQVLSGALGAQTPDFRKMAAQEYSARAQAARDEEQSTTREIQSALQAWAKDQETQRKSENDVANRELKSAEIYLRNKAMADRNAIMKLQAAGILDKASADAELARRKAEMLGDPMSRILQSKGDPALTATLMDLYDPNMGSNYRQDTSNLIQDKKSTQGTETRVTTSTSDRIIEQPGPNGTVVPTRVPFTRTTVTPGRPGTGRPGAFGMGPGGDRAALPEPIAQSRELPMGTLGTSQRRTRSTEVIGAPAQQPQAEPITPAQSRDGIRLGQDSPNTDASDRLDARLYMPTGATPLGFLKKPAKTQQADQKAEQEMRTASSLLDVVQEAGSTGKLNRTVGLRNNVLDVFLSPGATYGLRRALGDKEDLSRMTYENLLYRVGGQQVADYLQAKSGAQVSHQEFLRLRKQFPQFTDTPENFATLAYFNSVAPQLMTYLEDRKILNKGTVNDFAFGDYLATKAIEYTLMLDAAGKGNEKAKKRLGELRDIPAMAADITRRAFPQFVGKEMDVQLPPDEGGGTVRIKIPHPVRSMNSAESDRKKKQAEEDFNNWERTRRKK